MSAPATRVMGQLAGSISADRPELYDGVNQDSKSARLVVVAGWLKRS